MALGKYNRRTVMADTGAVIAGATVTFYNQLTGLPVTAYDDPDGIDPLGSSIVSGDDGEVEVFLPPGKYRITTELGSYSDEITYEPIVGDLAVIDATDVTNGLFLLDVPAETSFIRVLANGYSDLRTTAQVKIDLGLDNVNNTSDANKPISIATNAALDLKADLTDPRFTDAREWTASTIDQAEAEAGTATTRRAWTAQRVRQAIVAWWNTVGTTVGKAILNLANPSATRFLRINADNTVTARSGSEMRTDLGLGTVATQTVVTGNEDATTSRIPNVDWVLANVVGGGGFDYFNVTDYGATGDGDTDDSAAVQAAIDAAELVGGTVYFPRGTYILDPVYIGSDNVRLLGEGRLSILKRKPATVTNTDSVGIVNAHGTSMNRLSGIVLERLAFDGNKANIVVGPGGDIYDVECTSFIFVDHGLIQQCWAYDSTSEGFDFDDCADCVVLDCTAENCDGYGVHFSNGCLRMRGRGCFAYNCGVTLARGGFDCYIGLQYSSYEDCHARACYRGFVLGSEYNVLAGCTAIGSTINGVRVEGDGNIISNVITDGVSAGNGITVTGVRNIINGGQYRGASSSGVNILSGGTNNIVCGVVSTDNGAAGVNLQSGANNNIITTNQVGGNTAGDILDAGTGNTITPNIT